MTDQLINDLLDDENSQEEETVETPKAPREHLRQELSKKERTLEEAQAIREANQLSEDEEADYMKLADVAKYYRQNNIPVSRLVRATGGDRAMLPAIEGFEVKWKGRTRYLNGWVISAEAMERVANLSPKSRKKEETHEDMLNAFTKKQLVVMAEENEVEIDPKAKKAVIVEVLLQHAETIFGEELE